jgi:integrase
MKGHIRQRTKGTWTIIIDLGKDPYSGKRRQQWHTIKGTKRAAQRTLNEMLVAVEKGTYTKPSRLTLGDWLTQWLEGYVAMSTTRRTQESYRYIVTRHLLPSLGSIPISQMEPQQLQTYYAQALANGRTDHSGGLSARSVLYHHRILSEALSHAVKMGILARNVAELVEPPRPVKAQMRTLSDEEIIKFLVAARETSYYVFFSVLLCTGLRRGELLALRWRNVDLDRAVLYITETAFKLSNGEYVIKEPKTATSRRMVALPPSLVVLLKGYRADHELFFIQLGAQLQEDDFLFVRLDRKPLNPNAITLAFRRIIRKAGLQHIRVHDLRHTHASLMLKAGIHPKIVSERLGHANIGITLDTYSHVLPGLQEEAAEKFDQVLALGDKNENINVSKPLAKKEDSNGRPYRDRTCDTLIKSQVLYQLS